MTWSTRLPICLAALFFASSAFAEDDDDWLFDDEDGDEESDTTARPAEDEDTAEEGDPDEESDEWMEDFGEEHEELDFGEDEFEEDRDVNTQAEGEDTARIYRAHLEKVAALTPDEEAISWQRYLRKYPNSVFRARIDERLTELESEMYDERINTVTVGGVDAGQAELHFAQPLLLENIDPISKIRVGFEWGIPDYINLMADLEYQLFRELSVHGGIRNRYGNVSAEAGARYGIIKSARTQTLLTAIGDFRLGTNPVYPALRPQLAFGQRFDLGSGGRLDVQVQGGADMPFVPTSSGKTLFDPRLVGGANITLVPSPVVRVYLETSTYMKGFGWEEGGTFRFNVFTFGIKIMGRTKDGAPQYEIGAGATAPYTTNYWGYHVGSITGDFNYFL